MIRPFHAFIATLSLVSATAPMAQTATSVEYYNATLDHFFTSSLQADIDAFDSGRLPGWARTGQAFGATAAAGPGLNPVCRFYIPPDKGDSHFFSAAPDECQAVLARMASDPNYAGYFYESPAAWYTALPDRLTGTCPAGTVPVWRLWNGRIDSNHRYTANWAVRDQMLALGHTLEGYGPSGAGMCAPALAPTATLAAASGRSPLTEGCDGAASSGTAYVGAEVEPMLAVNPANPDNLVGVWQQDRWSNGSARGLVTGASLDGGRTWTLAAAAFSRCTGGNATNGGDYERASDPWVTFAPDGTAWQIALATAGQASAMLVSRSGDGGRTWSAPTTLIRDSGVAFNDKESITADRFDARFVYAIWDRLNGANGAPTYFARTTDGGASWEPARAIYNPGNTGQTINNQIVVLNDGTLVAFFTRLPTTLASGYRPEMFVLRSTDRGATWSAPIPVATVQSLGTRDDESGFLVRDGTNLGSIAAGPNGELAVVWQDARFSGGTHDGVAFSRSTDGGFTWSAPVRINGAPAAKAFVPVVHIRGDGEIGVSYYDLRNNLPDAATIPIDVWLTRSTDGVNWQETHVDGPFDLALAPYARGLFLGDYMGLASIGASFLPFYARTNAGSPDNATDVIAASTATLAKARRAARGDDGVAVLAQPAPPLPPSPGLDAMLRESAARTIANRQVR
jgi:hypothetical protein